MSELEAEKYIRGVKRELDKLDTGTEKRSYIQEKLSSINQKGFPPSVADDWFEELYLRSSLEDLWFRWLDNADDLWPVEYGPAPARARSATVDTGVLVQIAIEQQPAVGSFRELNELLQPLLKKKDATKRLKAQVSYDSLARRDKTFLRFVELLHGWLLRVLGPDDLEERKAQLAPRVTRALSAGN